MENMGNRKEGLNILCTKCGSFVGTFSDLVDYRCDCKESTKDDLLVVKDLNVLMIPTRKIFFITGATGAGKNYLTKQLKALNFENVPSITNRTIRPGEIVGKDYIYISNQEFKEIKDSGQLCEYVKYGDSEYGVSKKILLDMIWNSDKNLIIIVEPGGLQQMMLWFNQNWKLFQELQIELSTILLDIPRVERFFNLLYDVGLQGMYSDLHLHTDLLMSDHSTYEKLQKVLDRLVRNGDNITQEYKNMMGKLYDTFRSLEHRRLSVKDVRIQNKKEMSDFILELKCTYLGIDNMLKSLEAIEDQETLTIFMKLLNTKMQNLNNKKLVEAKDARNNN